MAAQMATATTHTAKLCDGLCNDLAFFRLPRGALAADSAREPSLECHFGAAVARRWTPVLQPRIKRRLWSRCFISSVRNNSCDNPVACQQLHVWSRHRIRLARDLPSRPSPTTLSLSGRWSAATTATPIKNRDGHADSNRIVLLTRKVQFFFSLSSATLTCKQWSEHDSQRRLLEIWEICAVAVVKTLYLSFGPMYRDSFIWAGVTITNNVFSVVVVALLAFAHKRR